LAEVLAGSKGKLNLGATIVEACAQRLFGFADAVLDAVFVQRQLLGGRRVGAGEEKHLQRVAQPGVRFVIDCKISKRPHPQLRAASTSAQISAMAPTSAKVVTRAPGLAVSATSWVRSA
jgi:hypothetical protein